MKVNFKLIGIAAALLLFAVGCTIIDRPTDVNSANEPTDLVVDPNCSALLFTDPQAECSLLCQYKCIEAGEGCEKEDPSKCKEVEQAIAEVEDNVNFAGINFGPPERAIPSLIRMFLYAVMGVISVAAIVMGIYGMVVRTTAGESPDKVEESAKIFQNAIIGVVVSTMGILIIQIIAMLLGVAQNLFDFNLVPLELTSAELTEACGDGSFGYVDADPSVDGVRNYICRGGSWEPYRD